MERQDSLVREALKNLLDDGSIKYWLGGHMADACVELALEILKEGLAKREADAQG